MAVEMLQPSGFGRIRLQRIDNDSDACVEPFAQANRQRRHSTLDFVSPVQFEQGLTC